MNIKIAIFSLLIFCLLVVPCSAWDASFEGHPSDSDSLVNYSEFSLCPVGHRYFLYKYLTTNQIAPLPIKDTWNGKIAFTGNSSRPAGYFGLRIYNSSGNVIFYDPDMVSNTDAFARYEFLETSSGNGIDYYKNGQFAGSTAFTIDSDDYSTYEIIFYSPGGAGYFSIDDITTSELTAMIGCDNEISSLNTYQYFTVGHPVVSEAYWLVKTYAPNGTVINTQNVSGLTEYLISKSVIQTSGTYSIKLFQHDNLSGNEYFYASKNFIFNQPSGVSLVLDKDEYERSDQMQIFSYIPAGSYTSGYTVKIGYNTGSGTEYYTYSVPSSDYTKSYALSVNAVGGSYSVYLLDPSGNIVASDEYYMSAPDGSTSVILDKPTYETSDTIKITYTGAPAGSTLYMYLRDSSSVLYSKTWSLTTTSGVKSYDLSNYPETTIVYVKIVKDSVLLADDRSTVFLGEYYLSGKVYDSVTKAAVEGAVVSVNGSSATTNEIGYYETPVNAGLQTVTILCNGYQQFTSNVYISDLLSTQNFYIVPTASTGSDSLYGVVVDYYTGSPVTGSYVQISNGTTTYSMLTNSNTGNYAFTQEGLAGSWTVTVTKTDYDNYIGSVTVSGDTYKQIRLVPINGYENTEEDSSNETSTERPGREAARDSMEQFEALAPALIALVVIKVIREVMK